MKTYIRIMLAALLLVSVPSLLVAQPAVKAPNFSLKSADGKTIELAKMKGKTVVLNFWATWCGPCRAEIPGFIEVYRGLQSKGLEIVGVSLDRNGWSVVRPYIEKSKIPYPIVVDEGGKVAEAYGALFGEISAIPTTFIVDKNGNVAKRHVGFMSKEDFRKMVTSVL